VRVETAGMQEDDFRIFADSTYLRISGKRQESFCVQSYYQMEIPFGEFALTITLPPGLKVSFATAYYQNGFLLITLPKIPE